MAVVVRGDLSRIAALDVARCAPQRRGGVRRRARGRIALDARARVRRSRSPRSAFRSRRASARCPPASLDGTDQGERRAAAGMAQRPPTSSSRRGSRSRRRAAPARRAATVDARRSLATPASTSPRAARIVVATGNAGAVGRRARVHARRAAPRRRRRRCCPRGARSRSPARCTPAARCGSSPAASAATSTRMPPP